MDIKDFILIGGGLLIAMVLGHGFWIAWRAKREPLRMDIVPDLIPDDIDEMERLRGELPNGGGRLVRHRLQEPAQEDLALDVDAPVLLDPAGEGTAHTLGKAEATSVTKGASSSQVSENRVGENEATDNKVTDTTPDHGGVSKTQFAAAATKPEPKFKAPFDGPKKLRSKTQPEVQQAPARPAYEEKQLDLGVTPEPVPSRVREVDFESEPLITQAPTGRRASRAASGITAKARASVTSRAAASAESAIKATIAAKKSRGQKKSEASGSVQDTSTPPPVVEELLIVNVLAPRGQRFAGEALINALRSQGLRYGDMNIFHRVDPTTKAKLYSVANAVEPGTFDLADLGSMESPGMTFFLQLPGPDDALGVFEDMLQAAGNVAQTLGGELRDDDMSVLTGQTKEHMRQRIADFARRRLSKRA